MLSARALGVVSAVVSQLTIGTAGAATLSLAGIGTPGVLSANFNPGGLAAINADGVGVGSAITIFGGTANTGGLSISANAALTFTFMGQESSLNNQLLIGNNLLFDNNASPGTTSATITANAGIVPFLFRNPSNFDANNGGAIGHDLEIAFIRVSDTVFYALFDDGGAGPDRDFDDMVVRISDPPLPAPLPGALPLFATGLGALGLLGSRKKRKAAA
jgi:hypothetical protein